MIVRVQLFAIAREVVGSSSIELSLADGATVADLRSSLGANYPRLTTLLPGVRVAVNSEYASNDQILPPAAEIALIPPVSGG